MENRRILLGLSLMLALIGFTSSAFACSHDVSSQVIQAKCSQMSEMPCCRAASELGQAVEKAHKAACGCIESGDSKPVYGLGDTATLPDVPAITLDYSVIGFYQRIIDSVSVVIATDRGPPGGALDLPWGERAPPFTQTNA